MKSKFLSFRIFTVVSCLFWFLIPIITIFNLPKNEMGFVNLLFLFLFDGPLAIGLLITAFATGKAIPQEERQSLPSFPIYMAINWFGIIGLVAIVFIGLLSSALGSR